MISFRLIDSFWDVLRVRSIRNSCRQFMTRDTRKIGILRQLQWWNDYKQAEGVDKWCYLMLEGKKSVGYGLVRRFKIGVSPNEYWLSGGLVPSVRGKGLGKILFQYLIDEFAAGSLFLEVRKSNGGAYSLYKKLGFEKILEEEGIVTMRWRNR